ncbi:MAG: amidophosphoribosyltransferase [SAR202 cluster bacterium]|nr:amidophosphoribosyltransferase [SAR202 cluster bacterium]
MSASGDIAREACGVVGVYSPGEDVARSAFFGIYALQHRGQESVGIAAADGTRIRVQTRMGLVSQSFEERDLATMPGHIAIGHTRYSTTGSSHIANAQPLISRGPDTEIALAHNGNIVNSEELKAELLGWGLKFNTTSDSEVIAHLISNAPAATWEGRIKYMMRRTKGAYSLAVMTKDALFAIRDPLGVRPLCLGKLNGGWVVASETCALDHIGATFIRDIEPGEAIMVSDRGLETIVRRESGDTREAGCIFEHIYFARPDSILNGKLVYSNRMAMGAELAKEHPVEADMVIGIPDSATAAAVGYSQASGIPYGEGLVKNRYVGRTFILPDQRLRELGVRRKLNPLPELIKGKRLVVLDDSIVRGTTTPLVVELLKRGGAKEIHLRICAPPIKYPCYLGVDLASRRELIAANKTVDEIRDFVGADSLGYLSNDGLINAVKLGRNKVCMACFTGNYPIPVQLEMDKLALETSKAGSRV